MFKLQDNKTHLHQWETNQIMYVDDAVDLVTFGTDFLIEPLTVLTKKLNDQTIAEVPNILLTDSKNIRVQLRYTDNKNSENWCVGTIEVLWADKPSDYIYTETEIFNYLSVVKKVEELEKQIIGEVNAVLYIEQKLTEEQQRQARSNIGIVDYSGAYSVKPGVNEQTINTAGKMLYDDITIKPISYHEVSNLQNGKTVIIGG